MYFAELNVPKNHVYLFKSQKFQIDGGHKFMLSYSRSSGLNSVATGVRTGAVDEPLG